MPSAELSSSVTLTKYSIFIQLMFRFSTFFLNAFLLRFMTREKLGLVNVRLTLLYMNAVFLSREAFRRACLGEGHRRMSQNFINLLWLILPTGCLVSIILGFLWLYVVEVDLTVFPDYNVAVISFIAASLIELTSEPFAIVSQSCQFVRLRAVAEGLAALLKCIFTVGLVYYFPDSGLLPFCLAQFVYCLTITCTFIFYYLYFFWNGLHKKMDDFPVTSFKGLLPTLGSIDRCTGRLVTSFWLQSVLKQLLTEGEKFVMTFFELVSLADQGVYDVINNLGSLVARSFFLPVEDGAFHLFSQNLVRGESAGKQNQTRLTETASALSTLLTSLSLVGFYFVFFGHAYAYLFLDLFGGQLLSGGQGPLILRWYCGYILLLAWNGVSEGFMVAVMRQDEVDRHSTRLVFYSTSFLVSAFVFVKWTGVIGFLWANYVNMTLRICHNIFFIRQFFKGTQFSHIWSAIFPDPFVVFSFVVSALVTLYSERCFCCNKGWLLIFLHIGVGASFVLIVAGLILIRHGNLRVLLTNYLHRKPVK